MIVAFDHMRLAAPAGSEDSARAHSCDMLGRKEIPKPAVPAARGGVWFQAGAVQIHIGVEDPFAPAPRKAHPALRVTGIRAHAERIAAHGAAALWNDDVPSLLRFYSHDPFGNSIEFIQPVEDAAAR